jgi:hypothetical protein
MEFEIHLAYIDPGTGSILFSILIGSAAALYFLVRAVFIRLKFFALGRKGEEASSRHFPFVIYNEGKHYWNVFKPIVEEFEKRAIPLVYYTSAEDDPFFEETFRYVTGTYIGEGNRAYMRLNFLRADVCLMTTPGLEVYQLKRSKGVKHYSHILHDAGDATCYRLFGIDWFDSLLLSGEYQKKDIRELERLRGTREKELVVTGCTYLDVLQEKKNQLKPAEERAFTVLVSPSWGSGALLSAFGERLLDPLSETPWRVIVRPHPQSLRSEKALLERLVKRYEGRRNVEWDYSPDNFASLSQADVMVSDFSGIVLDFIFLFEKPVLYASSRFEAEMYDVSDLDHEPWKFEAVKNFGVEITEENLPRIREIIGEAPASKELAAAAKTAREAAWQYRGESGKRAADELVSLRERITSSRGTAYV